MQIQHAQMTMARPARKPVVPAAPLFGHSHNGGDCCSVKPAASPKQASSSRLGQALKWAMAGVLGLGVGGTAVQNHMLRNEVTNANQALHARINDQGAALGSRLDGVNNQVSQINGRTTLDQIIKVVNRVTPATVRVEGPQGLGSGTIFKDNRGRTFILTNSHVVEDNDFNGAMRIKLYNGSDNKAPIEFLAPIVRLSSGDAAQSDMTKHDMAVLEIPPDVTLPANVVPVEMRDMTANPLQVGESVVAVGNPYGNRDSVSSGIISHADRNFSLEPQNVFIQTDAPINPGNSGGGLFDMQGRMIGMNTLGYRGADGLGGSIRIDVIKAVLERWGIPVHAQGEKPLDLKPLEARRSNPFER